MADLSAAKRQAAAALFTLALHSNLKRVHGSPGRPWGFEGSSELLEDHIMALQLSHDPEKQGQEDMQLQPSASAYAQSSSSPSIRAPSSSLIPLPPGTLDLLAPCSGLLPKVYHSLAVPFRSWPALMNLPLITLDQNPSPDPMEQKHARQQQQQEAALETRIQQQKLLEDEEEQQQQLIAMYLKVIDPDWTNMHGELGGPSTSSRPSAHSDSDALDSVDVDASYVGQETSPAGLPSGDLHRVEAKMEPVLGVHTQSQFADNRNTESDSVSVAAATCDSVLESPPHPSTIAERRPSDWDSVSFSEFVGSSSKSMLSLQLQDTQQQSGIEQTGHYKQPSGISKVAAVTQQAEPGPSDPSLATVEKKHRQAAESSDTTMQASDTNAARTSTVTQVFRLPPPPGGSPRRPAHQFKTQAVVAAAGSTDGDEKVLCPKINPFPPEAPRPKMLLAVSTLIQACMTRHCLTASTSSCRVASSLAPNTAARPMIEMYDARARTALYTVSSWMGLTRTQVRNLERLHAAQQLMLADRSLQQQLEEKERVQSEQEQIKRHLKGNKGQVLEEHKQQQKEGEKKLKEHELEKNATTAGAWFNTRRTIQPKDKCPFLPSSTDGSSSSSGGARGGSGAGASPRPADSKTSDIESSGAALEKHAQDARTAAAAVGPSKLMTALKVGGAALGAGALLAVTGGLAAPAIAAGLGATVAAFGGGAAIGASVAGTVGSVAGTATLAGGLGAYGANAARVHVSALMSQVEDFGFIDLEAAGNKDNPDDDKFQDDYRVWQDGGTGSGRQTSFEAQQEMQTGLLQKPVIEPSPLPPILPLPFLVSRAEDGAASVTIAVNGWVSEPEDFIKPWTNCPNGFLNRYALIWEQELLQSLGGALLRLVKNQLLVQSGQEAAKFMAVGGLVTALALPMAVITALNLLLGDNWNCALSRSKTAGILLAHQLTLESCGGRPVTLIGFSMGARLLFHCLLELQRIGRRGIVENVVLMGAPVSVDAEKWRLARSVVSGRFINAYSDNDWVLGLMYRLRSRNGIVNSASGLIPIKNVVGVENVGIGKLVGGHTGYVENMNSILEALSLDVE